VSKLKEGEKMEINKKVIKEKAKYLNSNNEMLYFFRDYKGHNNRKTVLENLTGLLLSDKALNDSRYYLDLHQALGECFLPKEEIDPLQNYSLLLLFEVANYLENNVDDSLEREKLKNQIRTYMKYVNPYMVSIPSGINEVEKSSELVKKK